MKLISFSLFFASFLVFNGVAQIFDLNSFLRGFLTSTKNNFKCGFPSLGIPSLDPYMLSSYSTTLNGNLGGMSNIHISVSNVNVTGLSNFNITSFDTSLFSMSMTFGITQNNLGFSGTHNSSLSLGNVPHTGSGNFTAQAQNIQLSVTISFSLFPFGVSSHKINSASIGSMITNFIGFDQSVANTINSNFLSGTPDWFTQNTQQISSELQTAWLSYISGKLSSSLDQTIAAIQSFSPGTC